MKIKTKWIKSHKDIPLTKGYHKNTISNKGQIFMPKNRDQKLKKGWIHVRWRRWPKKRIFLKWLKRNPSKKPGNARNRILGAIIHVHGDDKHHGVCYHKGRYQPGKPFLKMLYFSVNNGVRGCGRLRWLQRDRVDHVASPPWVDSYLDILRSRHCDPRMGGLKLSERWEGGRICKQAEG